MAEKLDNRLKNLSVTNLRAAKYNPRAITDKRLAALQSSMNTFGDLSGVVFNVRTKSLVSGHQRMKTVGKLKTRIVQQPHTDEHGTIAVGHIEVATEKGVIKIPYRAVDWSLKREKAANIAANAHGGEFDKKKLALVVADLENSKEFDIEVIGLDPLTLKTLKLGNDDEASTDKKEFKEYGSDTMQLEHTCPKCKYRF